MGPVSSGGIGRRIYRAGGLSRFCLTQLSGVAGVLHLQADEVGSVHHGGTKTLSHTEVSCGFQRFWFARSGLRLGDPSGIHEETGRCGRRQLLRGTPCLRASVVNLPARTFP